MSMFQAGVESQPREDLQPLVVERQGKAVRVVDRRHATS
jgi:hypothetical protein